MFSFVPSHASVDAGHALSQLISPPAIPDMNGNRIRVLRHMYSLYRSFCRPPCAGYGVHVTTEINYQSEQWLPLERLRTDFYQFYRQVLTYPPVLSSTPFAGAASWAAIVSRFPPFLQEYTNPGVLLQQLLSDADFCLKFLCWSFMPERFYGDGADRYPGQAAVLEEWFRQKNGRVRCLDAACGDGSAAYGVARLLLEQGWNPDRFRIAGWTLDPLEAWAAAYGMFPHNSLRETRFREWVAPVFEKVAHYSMLFSPVDLMEMSDGVEKFDLILCNGLLGGPIINRSDEIGRVVANFRRMLTPGGMILVANRFHGGWKKNIPGEILGDAFRANGLSVTQAGEGLSGQAP
jgi:SAM-dependent methyltransferase